MKFSTFVVAVALLEGVLGGYPTYSAGYGFISHGGIGPHGEYLPAVARVKVQKDPYQSHYSVDEEGPTHYKYVRHSSTTHPADPDLYQPPPIIGHHHQGVAAPAVPIHGGVIGAAGGVAPYPLPLGYGVAADPYYGYNYNQFDPAYAHGGFY